MGQKKEIWKDIPNYEGYYQASNLGRVRSLDRYVIFRDGRKRHYKECIINGTVNNVGYIATALSKKNAAKTFSFAQLVAMAFLGHKPDGLNRVVDHIDGNRTNNRLENLRIVTHRENTSTCFRADRSSLSSKYEGVCWINFNSKWRASIQHNKFRVILGLFDSEVDASDAYQHALSKIKNGLFKADDYKPKYSSKYKGVSFNKKMRKWTSKIRINGGVKYLGSFNTELEAHHAYQKALKERHHVAAL